MFFFFFYIILKNKHSNNTNFCALQFQYFLKDPVKYDVKYQVSSFIELQLYKDLPENLNLMLKRFH